jgi:hypothetical protein
MLKGRTHRVCLSPNQTLPTLLLLLFLIPFQLSGQCSMACDNQVNLALDASCSVVVTPDLVLESFSADCDPADFLITVYQPNGINPIPTSPEITALQIGQLLPVLVEYVPSGNSCWSSIQVSDNLPPQLICPPDVAIACSDPITPFDVGSPQVSDCQSYTQNYFDTFTDTGCNDPTGYYTRTWSAVDAGGNFSSCIQTITLAEADLSEVVFPPNLNGVDAPALACPDPDTSPGVTGVPTLNGSPIPEGGECELSVFYSDLEVPGCGASYALLRTWSVLEWCSGNIEQETQVIVVDDAIGPVTILPDTLFAYTNDALECTADVTFPAAQLSDNCSDTITVLILTPFGSLPTNGGVLSDIPLGTYEVVYQATDACANVTADTVQLVIQDNMPPIAICDQITGVSLGPFGTTMVFAETFDDGSFDNCCPIDLAVRRLDGLCDQPDTFASTVTFCCVDIGTVVEVELRAMDCFGNANFCDVQVVVNDQIDPEIVCPADVIIACDSNPLDLDLTGEPYVFDGCGVDTVFYADTENLNECSIGTITRIWTVDDALGNSSTCSQLITLEDQTPVVITFPPDLEVFGCYDLEDLDPEDLSAPYDFPVISNDDCELIATNVSDQVFTITQDACLKIVRTWTLIDWCVFDPNDSDSLGVYVGVQTIKVIDNDPPTLTCPPDQLVEIIGTDCFTSVVLPDPMIDDCDPDTEFEIISDLGTGNGPFQAVGPGTYSANYFATDGCNNTTSCSIEITVVDAKAPTPYCLGGATITLMPVDTTGDGDPDIGQIELLAANYDLGSFDNCDSDPGFSFSADPTDTTQLFDCSQLGFNMVEIWVTDAAGNQDFCQTVLIIQDNIGVCNDGTLPVVGGMITDEMGQPMEGVRVTISDTAQSVQLTDVAGLYDFSNLILGLDYSVVPNLDTAVRNGVTTWDLAYMTKHILGIQPLDSPYKIIAADADRNGVVSTLDIVALQQIILFLEEDLPNGNTSWRFVPTSYQFQDPTDPLAEGFPEVINLNDLETDYPDADFMGIKVGDVNNSASPNGLFQVDDRSDTPEVSLIVEQEAVNGGEVFELVVQVDDLQSLVGIQGALEYDLLGMEILAIEAPLLENWTRLNYGFPDQYPGQLTLSYIQEQEAIFEGDDPLLIIRGRALRDGSPTDWIRVSKLLSPEVYSDSEDPRSWKLDVQESIIEEHLSVFPTLISDQFEVCNAGKAGQIRIVSASGHWQASYKLQGCLQLSVEDLPGSGLYFILLEGANEVQKIVAF